MAARAGKKMAKGAKKVLQQQQDVIPFLRVTIQAGKAAPAPPLGPQLGQVIYKLHFGKVLKWQLTGNIHNFISYCQNNK